MVIPCDPSLRARLIAVSQEEAMPDLLIRGARIWNSYTGEVLPGDIAVCADRLAKVGPWNGTLATDTVLIEADGRVAVPGADACAVRGIAFQTQSPKRALRWPQFLA